MHFGILPWVHPPPHIHALTGMVLAHAWRLQVKGRWGLDHGDRSIPSLRAPTTRDRVKSVAIGCNKAFVGFSFSFLKEMRRGLGVGTRRRVSLF